MPKKKKEIVDLVHETYSDPEVCDTVLEEIAKHGTEDKILSGELALPSEHDARRHHTGEAAEEEKLRQLRRRTG